MPATRCRPRNRLHGGGVGGDISASTIVIWLVLFAASIRTAKGIAIDPRRQPRHGRPAVGDLHGSGPSCDVGRIQQADGGDRSITRVVHPVEAVGIGPGLGLGQPPPDLRLSWTGPLQVGAPAQQGQGLQQRQPSTAGGRHGADQVLQLFAAERRSSQHGVAVQIGLTPAAEVGLAGLQPIDRAEDPLRQGPLIKSRATVSGQDPQCLRQGGVAERLIRRWWLAAR